MSWMDLSNYLVIEEAAAARIDDLRHEAASHTSFETPARPRAPLFKWDVPRRIDEVIDYFGDACPQNQRQSVRGCG
jgi:hypothetical protein